MYNHVTCLDDIDISQLKLDLQQLLTRALIGSSNQLSVTSMSGNDDWDCSTGKIHNLQHPERFYAKLNQSLVGTEFEKIVNKYSQYYRWRILKLPSNTNYSIHADSSDPNKRNLRLHIPIITNPQCYMIFFDKDQQHMYHMEEGKVYEADTSGLHSAINFSNTDRYHLVGVRYENSNHRT